MIAWYEAKYLRFQGRKWWCDRCCNPGLLVIWSEPWSALRGGAAAHPEKSLAARWTQKVSLFQQICCDTSKGKWQIDNCLGILFSTNPFVKETRALQGNIGNKNELFEQGLQDWIWILAEVTWDGWTDADIIKYFPSPFFFSKNIYFPSPNIFLLFLLLPTKILSFSKYFPSPFFLF